MEDALLDLMYEIPSDKTIEKIIVTKQAIEKKKKPVIIRSEAPHGQEAVTEAFETTGTDGIC